MSIEMIIKEIQEAVSEHKSIYLSNEQAVRDTLINPILNELGWNTKSLKFVIPNAPDDVGKIPDYTLIKNNKKVLVIEAKNMSVEISDVKIISQLVAYCYNPGIKFGIITNGAQWLLFSTFQPNPNERIVWRLDLLSDDMENIQKKLNCISYEHIEQVEQLSTSIYNDEILKKTWEKLINDRDSIVNNLSIQFELQLKNSYPNFVIDVEKIKSFIKNELRNLLKIETVKPQSIETVKPQSINSEPVEPPITEPQKRVKIRVTFPDGVFIYHNKVADTFSEAIKKIGVEKVKQLNIIRSGVDLVSEKKHSKYQQYKVSQNCFIMTNTSTKDKIKLLYEINQRLNVGMIIEETQATD